MGKTKIEWATDTWNPTTGCSKVSTGCAHCYAERVAERFWGDRKFTDVQCHPDRLEQPLHWRKPRRVFVDSMSDLFHEDVPFEFIAAVFGVMSVCENHTFMVLTKRPERMLEWYAWIIKQNDKLFPFGTPEYIDANIVLQYVPQTIELSDDVPGAEWPLKNVWLGVSVENQAAADERIPLLLRTPAAKRFVSCEPLLGSIYHLMQYMRAIKTGHVPSGPHGRNGGCPHPGESGWCGCGIDWVIAGGESGPNARRTHPGWVRELRDQCQAVRVPFFFKQWGHYSYQAYPNDVVIGFPVGRKTSGRLLDGREWNEFPEGAPCG
jgi:protein gp37